MPRENNDASEKMEPCSFLEDIPKPKRPLSAYNYFFQAQRKEILEESVRAANKPEGKPEKSNGKIGFANLARTVATRWKLIDKESLKYFDHLALEDKNRYDEEMEEWRSQKAIRDRSFFLQKNIFSPYYINSSNKGLLQGYAPNTRPGVSNEPACTDNDMLHFARQEYQSRAATCQEHASFPAKATCRRVSLENSGTVETTHLPCSVSSYLEPPSSLSSGTSLEYRGMSEENPIQRPVLSYQNEPMPFGNVTSSSNPGGSGVVVLNDYDALSLSYTDMDLDNTESTDVSEVLEEWRS